MIPLRGLRRLSLTALPHVHNGDVVVGSSKGVNDANEVEKRKLVPRVIVCNAESWNDARHDQWTVMKKVEDVVLTERRRGRDGEDKYWYWY